MLGSGGAKIGMSMVVKDDMIIDFNPVYAEASAKMLFFETEGTARVAVESGPSFESQLKIDPSMNILSQ